MECWNATCMLSQLPIKYGDDVVLIPIIKESTSVPFQNIYYSNDLFKPLPIILKGQYNDYGYIDNGSGDIDQFINFVSNRSYLSLEQLQQKQKCFSYVEACLRYITDEELFNAGFVMIHSSMFYNLLDYCEKSEYVIDTTNRLHNLSKSYDKDNLLNLNIEDLSDYIDLFGRNIIKNANYESIENIIRFDNVLSILRKMWIPQSYCGSQKGLDSVHEAFYKLYKDYVDSNIEEDEIDD